ncbi:MAG TPA: cobalamin-independent methionine synthase II family protein [Solirubrobacteraceae bacterium]|nr:cobalamin-independent methionine synthase II family protein [Solirubrobacteraceae bacterium]
MATQILTTHVGSLPRPERLIELNAQRADGDRSREEDYVEELRRAVAAVVKRQHAAGLDIVNDGEYGHAINTSYDYGPWWTYAWSRLGGLEMQDIPLWGVVPAQTRPPEPGQLTLASFGERRDWNLFKEAYGDPGSGAALPSVENHRGRPVCVGPLSYVGRELIARDIANVKAALDAAGVEEGFMNALAPGSARFANEYYQSDEEMLFACADALREEYAAIIDAGLILQLDDPAITENWDQITPEPSVEDYRRFTMIRIDALNHAIRDLPAERIRFHLCWGSWHGPHVTDIPLADIVDAMLAINAGAYSFEAANVRHEHEWRVWEQVELPAGKRILPGVVSHATNVVEHPQLVADRILRFARIVGPERVVASTDCGLGGRVHPQIAWAKLESLAAGAALASQQI